MFLFIKGLTFPFFPLAWLTFVSVVAGKMDTDPRKPPQGHLNILPRCASGAPS